MTTEYFPPSNGLKHLIKCYIIMNFNSKRGDGFLTKPYPPSGSQYLSFYLKDPLSIAGHGDFIDAVLPPSFIVGPQTNRVDLQFKGEIRFLGVIFWPGCFQKLLRLPMTELYNNPCNSNEVLGTEIDLITEQLSVQKNNKGLLEVIDAYMRKKLRRHEKKSRPIERILPMILQNNEYCSIDKLIRLSCLSTRQFERTFLNYVGMPAKQYLRIVRFSSAYKLKDDQPGTSWLQIALNSGYYDYAHMVKDFCEFTGLTPPAFRELDLNDSEKAYTQFI